MEPLHVVSKGPNTTLKHIVAYLSRTLRVHMSLRTRHIIISMERAYGRRPIANIIIEDHVGKRRSQGGFVTPRHSRTLTGETAFRRD